jgi:hypothetical protein
MKLTWAFFRSSIIIELVIRLIKQENPDPGQSPCRLY